MPMLPETLNAQLKAYEAHTGVYKSKNARPAVVVKAKGEMVYFLHLSPNCTIELASMSREMFLQQYPIELYHYPVLRVVRMYAKWVRHDGFPITEEARKVVNAIIAR